MKEEPCLFYVFQWESMFLNAAYSECSKRAHFCYTQIPSKADDDILAHVCVGLAQMALNQWQGEAVSWIVATL